MENTSTIVSSILQSFVLPGGMGSADWIIKKAYQDDQGVMRWQATVSKFDRDQQNDKVTQRFYTDAIGRFKAGHVSPPFLSVAHYTVERECGKCGAEFKSLSEYTCKSCGEERWIAGVTEDMWIDGKQPKAKGLFYPTQIGKAAFEAVRTDIVQKTPFEERIRVSMGFYPDPGKGTVLKGHGARDFISGWVEHFALTRVPVVPETPIEASLEEKSMAAIVTKMDDAKSIVPDLAEELDRRTSRGKREKSNAGPELVIKNETTDQVFPPAPEQPRAEMPCPQCKSATVPTGEPDCPECGHMVTEEEVNKHFGIVLPVVSPNGEVKSEIELVEKAHMCKCGMPLKDGKCPGCGNGPDACTCEEQKHFPGRHDQKTHGKKRGVSQEQSTKDFETKEGIREPYENAYKPGSKEFNDRVQKEINDHNNLFNGEDPVFNKRGTFVFETPEELLMWTELDGQMSDGKYENSLNERVWNFYNELEWKIDPSASSTHIETSYGEPHRNLKFTDLDWLFSADYAWKDPGDARAVFSHFNNEDLHGLMKRVTRAINEQGGQYKSKTEEEDEEYDRDAVINANRKEKAISKKEAKEAIYVDELPDQEDEVEEIDERTISEDDVAEELADDVEKSILAALKSRPSDQQIVELQAINEDAYEILVQNEFGEYFKSSYAGENGTTALGEFTPVNKSWAEQLLEEKHLPGKHNQSSHGRKGVMEYDGSAFVLDEKIIADGRAIDGANDLISDALLLLRKTTPAGDRENDPSYNGTKIRLEYLQSRVNEEEFGWGIDFKKEQFEDVLNTLLWTYSYSREGMVKHLPGQHDQKDHGREASEQATRIFNSNRVAYLRPKIRKILNEGKKFLSEFEDSLSEDIISELTSGLSDLEEFYDHNIKTNNVSHLRRIDVDDLHTIAGPLSSMFDEAVQSLQDVEEGGGGTIAERLREYVAIKSLVEKQGFPGQPTVTPQPVPVQPGQPVPQPQIDKREMLLQLAELAQDIRQWAEYFDSLPDEGAPAGPEAAFGDLMGSADPNAPLGAEQPQMPTEQIAPPEDEEEEEGVDEEMTPADEEESGGNWFDQFAEDDGEEEDAEAAEEGSAEKPKEVDKPKVPEQMESEEPVDEQQESDEEAAEGPVKPKKKKKGGFPFQKKSDVRDFIEITEKARALREAFEATREEKHYPGKHDQKTHGGVQARKDGEYKFPKNVTDVDEGMDVARKMIADSRKLFTNLNGGINNKKTGNVHPRILALEDLDRKIRTGYYDANGGSDAEYFEGELFEEQLNDVMRGLSTNPDKGKVDIISLTPVGKSVKPRPELSENVKDLVRHPADSLVRDFSEAVATALKSQSGRVDKRKAVQEALNSFAERVLPVIDETTAPTNVDVAVVVQEAVDKAVREAKEQMAQEAAKQNVVLEAVVKAMGLENKGGRRSLSSFRPQGPIQGEPVQKSSFSAREVAEGSVRQSQHPLIRY